MLTPEEEERKAALLDELKRLEDGARARWIEEAQSKTYSFANIPNSADLAIAKEFQKVFGRHIEDVRYSEHMAIVLHSKMMSGIFGNPTETIRRSTFDADLKRLRKAVQLFAEHPTAYWQHVASASFEAGQGDRIAEGAHDVFDFVLRVQGYADEGILPEVLNKYEAWARQAVGQLPDRRNINWEAVHAVMMLRAYWESWAEIPAPRRALNPESPFADYLRDAFAFFQINGDPISAFKRWAALADEDQNLVV
ncbi:hypothetical protein LB543_28030 [Mesorhizobium sp. ESP7-2]|uniref:hypothetical protein n=1 Tax=Mesorhizobium sp. ESP7-2 TaxID=2876622 RepID=UPI001CCA45CB|nr:hypothetical protein [Mesorhizobium sp. ESP7-2]MBZ9710551.1 hypothetical protein [Mesorhizobium sp. ESP7-2]